MNGRCVSKQECNDFWGRKKWTTNTTFTNRVSPRMKKQILALYERVFQQSYSTLLIPYQFGRGLLAEQMGWPINWAGYTAKVSKHGPSHKVEQGVPIFVTYVERMRRLPKEG